MAPKGLFVRPFLGHLDNDHPSQDEKIVSQNHDFYNFLDTLDDDHLRKMKKSGP